MITNRYYWINMAMIACILVSFGLGKAHMIYAETLSRNPFVFDKAPQPATPSIKKEVPIKHSPPPKKDPTFIWRIQGIFQSEKGNFALLNYGFVTVGDVLHGWTVKAIESEFVTLEKEGKKIKIRFERS